jgi:hypothetical protein
MAAAEWAFCHHLKPGPRNHENGTAARHVVARDYLLAQVDGAWLVTQEDASVPFDVAGGLARP